LAAVVHCYSDAIVDQVLHLASFSGLYVSFLASVGCGGSYHDGRMNELLRRIERVWMGCKI